MAQPHQFGTTRPMDRPNPGRGGGLDALRFLASLLIVLYHYGTQAPVPLDQLHPVFSRGFLATDFFLILSGYVLGQAYGAQVLSGRVGTVRFVVKRVTRLWPGQAIMLLALAVVVGLSALAGFAPAHPEHFTLRAFWMQLFLVQSLGVPGGAGWNTPSWSLSALLVCYAIFPLAWRWVSRVRDTVLPTALALISVLSGDLICQMVLGHAISDLPLHLGMLRAMPLFLLGVCIARTVQQGAPSLRIAKDTAWASAAILVVLQLIGRLDMASIVAIAALVLAWGRLPVRKPSATIEAAAKLSFALFITHTLSGLVWFGLATVVERSLPASPAIGWTLWALAFPFAMVVAGLFHRYVDSPLQALIAPLLATRRIRTVSA
ncbi:peptidoglycan/LPS O-acetylase OafA/YrhL [Caulobacter ginsengisoli]|uniref:Peptidoglycan/LPS O-acetylase OafA/YrhL n=1 Tax=Caulobacter ginsengisoli TaxID=400775 RepID=A0ABU0IY21_9CAUL|nr:acyltransferase [Caulobacter ginsengisoli]MDQ0466078.1 peptidoglycan/LPS O-acetylase OafA/YrhL [Caulobacter ginsengisoli]